MCVTQLLLYRLSKVTQAFLQLPFNVVSNSEDAHC